MVTRAWIEARMEGGEAAEPAAPGSLFYGTTRTPLIVRPEDGGFEAMGGKLPDRSFTVQDVAKLVGPDRQVDVIGIAYTLSGRQELIARCGNTIFITVGSKTVGRIRTHRSRSDRQLLESIQYHFARSDRNGIGQES
jgi:hypothetical protein